jgi:ParB-like chromosome segregation protein Spo0J
VPILAPEDGTVIAGHGRLLAGQAEGVTEVPVIVARGWTAEQCRAYTIADNSLAGPTAHRVPRTAINPVIAGPSTARVTVQIPA